MSAMSSRAGKKQSETAFNLPPRKKRYLQNCGSKRETFDFLLRIQLTKKKTIQLKKGKKHGSWADLPM